MVFKCPFQSKQSWFSDEQTTIDVNAHNLHKNYSIAVSVTVPSHQDDMSYSVDANSKLASAELKLSVAENTKCVTVDRIRIVRHQYKWNAC